MTSISKQFPSKWLKCVDLGGKSTLLTICDFAVGVEMEEGKPETKKPVIYFDEISQGLGLNKTNGNNLLEFLGDNMEAWIGCKIVAYPTTTDFQGKTVDCIRVRKPKNQTKATEAIVEEEIPY